MHFVALVPTCLITSNTTVCTIYESMDSEGTVGGHRVRV